MLSEGANRREESSIPQNRLPSCSIKGCTAAVNLPAATSVSQDTRGVTMVKGLQAFAMDVSCHAWAKGIVNGCSRVPMHVHEADCLSESGLRLLLVSFKSLSSWCAGELSFFHHSCVSTA